MSSQETKAFEVLDENKQEEDNDYKIDDDCNRLLFHNGSDDDSDITF